MQISMIPSKEVQTIHCSQNDTKLRKWTFSLYANDVLVKPIGDCSLICENGAEIPLTIEGNNLLCDCTGELSSVAGYFDCKIKIVNGGDILYSSLFNLYCEVKP